MLNKYACSRRNTIVYGQTKLVYSFPFCNGFFPIRLYFSVYCFEYIRSSKMCLHKNKFRTRTAYFILTGNSSRKIIYQHITTFIISVATLTDRILSDQTSKLLFIFIKHKSSIFNIII